MISCVSRGIKLFRIDRFQILNDFTLLKKNPDFCPTVVKENGNFIQINWSKYRNFLKKGYVRVSRSSSLI